MRVVSGDFSGWDRLASASTPTWTMDLADEDGKDEKFHLPVCHDRRWGDMVSLHRFTFSSAFWIITFYGLVLGAAPPSPSSLEALPTDFYLLFLLIPFCHDTYLRSFLHSSVAAQLSPLPPADAFLRPHPQLVTPVPHIAHYFHIKPRSVDPIQ